MLYKSTPQMHGRKVFQEADAKKGVAIDGMN